MVIINTERFQLKSLTTKDVTEKYLSWFNQSKEIEKYISFAQKCEGIDSLMQYVKDKKDREDVLFLGIFCSLGQHIGNIKYEPIDLKNKTATMGILIGDKEWRGKGVASEVIKISGKYLKNNYGIKYIDLGVDKSNARAISAYEKINFKIIEENNTGFKMQLDFK
jgi:RimJ/RimL family protein N-acetyltransferase